jgi:hypothetical protein
MRHFYIDSNNKKRKYGIFAPGLDRFILIDPADYWMLLETAEILSSKLPTMVYMLPSLDFELNTGNCLDYTVHNKTQEKIGPSNIAIGRQNPSLKYMFDENKIVFAGVPEDYKTEEKQEIINRLQQFAKYVQKRVYALNLTEAIFNSYNRKHFLEKYAKSEWYENFQVKPDRSETEKGTLFEIKNALYLASSIEDAEDRIKQIWLTQYREQQYLIFGYYRILQEPVPAELASLTTFKVETSQWYCI